MDKPVFGELLMFLQRLEWASIHYSLGAPTLESGAIMVKISVPGEYWEIEFHEDGNIGVEVFVSRDGVEGAEAIDELFDRFSD